MKAERQLLLAGWTRAREDIGLLRDPLIGGMSQELFVRSIALLATRIFEGAVRKNSILTIAAAIVALAALSACGGGTSAVSEQATPKAKIQGLEESGVIPKLERSETVGGIDADVNGIRDDVETFIASEYHTPEQQAAGRQFASVMQAALLVDKEDGAAVKAISLRGARAVNCIYQSFNDGEPQPAAVVRQIRSVSTNTKQRLLTYLAYSKALDGTTSALPEGNTCE